MVRETSAGEAATVGSLKIVEVLYTNLQPAERSDRILLDTYQAALHGCHGGVAEYLWKRIPDRDRVWGRQLNLDIARYGTITLLTEAILNLKCHNEPSEEGILCRTDPGSDGSAYGHYFSSMLECAVEHGNIEKVKAFLKMPPSPNQDIPDGALWKAAKAGHFEAVELLLASKWGPPVRNTNSSLQRSQTHHSTDMQISSKA